MMETKKLFYSDPFLSEFTATVLSCEAAKNGFAVVLDQTAFYPEGGGQPADRGSLNTSQVLDVHEKDGMIAHLCDSPLPVGAAVLGKIDWTRRFDHMQQHSGEHICSGLICEQFHCDNVGFHLGAESVTIDFNANIPWDALMAVEAQANQYIYENHPIDIRFYRGNALEAIEYRSKKELDGEVRIVTFPGADCCACCGTHVVQSGQIGIVKFLSCQKFRGGSRIELLCGQRAYHYLSTVWQQSSLSAQAMSVKPTTLLAGVEHLQKECAALKLHASHLEDELFCVIAAQHQNSGNVLLFRDEMPADSVRRLCDAVSHTCGGRCAVFAGGGTSWKYAVGQVNGDLREWNTALTQKLHSRGGGKPSFMQGSVTCSKAEIEAFFSQNPSK
mgnify:CR=1 FL=1